MALSGIQIFKMMPKKNCGECGVPTCLAFSMNLAAGKAELEACPYVSDEAKEALASASAPPIRTVEIGTLMFGGTDPVTGTAAEVIGVVDIDGRIIGDGHPGPITRQLRKQFFEYAHGDQG